MKWILIGFALIAASGVSNGDIIIPPPPGDQCNGPVPGEGLGEALRELIDLLPIEKLLEIFMTWVTNDEEVMAAMEYVGSPDFTHIVTVMQKTPEFGDIMEYLCLECYFDAYYYLNALGGLFNFPPMLRPYQLRISFDGLTGFRGMMRQLGDALPLDELREIHQRRLATDKYYKLALDKIGSQEFRDVGCAIQATKEYDELIEKLENIGVDTNAVLDALFAFFRWPVDC